MMTKHQLESEIGQLEATLYWHERGTFPVQNPDEIKEKNKKLQNKLDNGEYVDEINEHGNIVIRMWRCLLDRYYFDFERCTAEKGWVQFDTKQDFSHFGIWVHPS